MQLLGAIVRIIATLAENEGCAASMMTNNTALLEALLTAADVFHERAFKGLPWAML